MTSGIRQKLLLAAGFISSVIHLYGQGEISRVVHLDTVVIRATRLGFDVPGFIQMVKEDTTFYQAFRNLRINNYTSANHIEILGKKDKAIASYNSRTRQYFHERCRWMVTENEAAEGKFFDNDGGHEYYTSELFFHLFFTKDTVCASGGRSRPPMTENEKRKEQLKTLIFNPGKPVEGIPFIGKKTAIFDPEMVRYYDYSITSAFYRDSLETYVFKVSVKDDIPSGSDKVVIRELETWFLKRDFSIVARRYALSWFSLPFDFDVKMEVRLKPLDAGLIVEHVGYNGFWDIPFRKQEKATFEIDFEIN